MIFFQIWTIWSGDVEIDKDKEALLFNVAYNVTDNISSQAILRHNNNLNRYLPALLYLPSTTPFLCDHQQESC